MKKIALTFDDGPNNETREIMNILERYQIKATFFIWAEFVEKFSDVVEELVSRGHHLGNHTLTHPNLLELSKEEVLAEVSETDEILANFIDQKPHLFRPPYGYINDEIREWIDKEIVLWTVDSKDWSNIPEQEIIDNVMNQVTNNDIVLLHCFEETVKALPVLLDKLVAEQYKFVSVDEVIK